jgi:hypothetical protein
MSPKEIQADGNTYFACQGIVWSGSEGGGLLGSGSTFKISFTDINGVSNVIRGIKSLSVRDLPMEPAPMPDPLPNPNTGMDSNGSHFIEGSTYTWRDGTKARLQNGAWKAIMQPNQICAH